MTALRTTRRGFLRVAGGAGAAIGLGLSGRYLLGVGGNTGEVVTSTAALPTPFEVPLPVPPVLRATRTDASTDFYEIVQREAAVEVLPGLKTPIWGYDGRFPGPTIESRSGRTTVVRHRNELPVPTVVHLHGGMTPPDSDGYPTDLVLPQGAAHGAGAQHAGMAGKVSRGAKDYVYPLDQRATTLWYHDHRMDFTGPAVYRGLAGFHLVRDAEDDRAPLPDREREIPLMIVDRAFGEDGELLYPAKDPSLTRTPGVEENHVEGVMGDVILVNGAPWPVHEVSNTRHRLRILNASNARRYELVLDPAPPEGPAFVQVGSDGGLLASPKPHASLTLASAERLDVIVDFSAYRVGTEVTVRNKLGEGSTEQVMRFVVARREREESSVPSRLSEIEPLVGSDAVATREVSFRRGEGTGAHAWSINDKPFDLRRTDARPKLGTVEIWRFTSDLHHPIHLHGAHFQVLRRSGGELGPSDAGWKDTIDITPGESADVITRFDGFRGRYVFHCHNLEHEDMGMMANLEIV